MHVYRLQPGNVLYQLFASLFPAIHAGLPAPLQGLSHFFLSSQRPPARNPTTRAARSHPTRAYPHLSTHCISQVTHTMLLLYPHSQPERPQASTSQSAHVARAQVTFPRPPLHTLLLGPPPQPYLQCGLKSLTPYQASQLPDSDVFFSLLAATLNTSLSHRDLTGGLLIDFTLDTFVSTSPM